MKNAPKNILKRKTVWWIVDSLDGTSYGNYFDSEADTESGLKGEILTNFIHFRGIDELPYEEIQMQLHGITVRYAENVESLSNGGGESFALSL